MMKKMQRIAVLALAICMILGTMIVNAEANYEHRLTVSGGNGEVGSGLVTGKTAKIDISAKTVTVDGTSYDISLPGGDDEKYVVLGLKQAGHDNSEVYTDSVTFDVTGAEASTPFKNKDLELVVAYGLRSNLVEYTVEYLDENGDELLPTETHYTVDGTRAVVSYKYAEGYLPDMISAVKTIEAGGDNTITFTYYVNEGNAGEPDVVVINDGAAGGGAGAAGAGAAGAGAAGAADAGAADIGDAAAPLAPDAGDNVVDLDDNQTPLVDGDTDGDVNGDGVIDDKDDTNGDGVIDDNDIPAAKPGVKAGPIAAGAALVAAVAAAAVAIARRRRADEDDEADDEE